MVTLQIRVRAIIVDKLPSILLGVVKKPSTTMSHLNHIIQLFSFLLFLFLILILILILCVGNTRR